MNTQIICIEGITGAGKTTQVNILRDYLNRRNISNFIINEKQFDPFKQVIIQWHRDGADLNFNYNQIKLIARAREKTHKKHFFPLLGKVKYIIFDRNYLTSAVYQCGEDISFDKILKLNLQENILIPDQTVILTCETKIALQRINRRRKKVRKYNLPSVHENYEMIKLRSKQYKQLADTYNGLYDINTSNKKKDIVFNELKAKLYIN